MTNKTGLMIVYVSSNPRFGNISTTFRHEIMDTFE